MARVYESPHFNPMYLPGYEYHLKIAQRYERNPDKYSNIYHAVCDPGDHYHESTYNRWSRLQAFRKSGMMTTRDRSWEAHNWKTAIAWYKSRIAWLHRRAKIIEAATTRRELRRQELAQKALVKKNEEFRLRALRTKGKVNWNRLPNTSVPPPGYIIVGVPLPSAAQETPKVKETRDVGTSTDAEPLAESTSLLVPKTVATQEPPALKPVWRSTMATRPAIPSYVNSRNKPLFNEPKPRFHEKMLRALVGKK